MDFRILGPLEVWDEGQERSLGGPRTRALLALLLLHANEVVSADRLIDELWGGNAGESTSTALRVNVSRLRKALSENVLATRAPGYTIRIERGDLDLWRFEGLVDEARRLHDEGALTAASARLREALALWRGPPLADLAYAEFAQGAIARLEEMRLAALELRIEIDLALGRHVELVAELRSHVADQPLRERLVWCLMTALYRCGRQAEALAAYRDARHTLVDELGIEPAASLQDLERAILRQDQGLDLTHAAATSIGADGERSVLVAISDETRIDALLAVAEPLVRNPPRVLILARLVRTAPELAAASAWLDARRPALASRGILVRTACFTAAAPGPELARLASELAVDLLLVDLPDDLLADGLPDEQLGALLASAPCDVAVLRSRDARPEGAVLVPFGGAEHDWAAVELGAWFARAEGVPLRLAGVDAVPEEGRRDASRLLSHGSLAVQRVLGVSAEPLLVGPGADALLAASREAGLLVVGLSTRWHRQGLGEVRLRLARDAVPPTLLVRRGLRPSGLAPRTALTRFTWSLGP